MKNREMGKYITVLSQTFVRLTLKIYVCMYVDVFTVFIYLLCISSSGIQIGIRRYVEQTRVLLVQGDTSSPRDFRVAL